MRLRQDCSIRSLRGKYLLFVRADAGDVSSWEVNESFAFLFETLQGSDFDSRDIAKILVDEYGLDAGLADGEAVRFVGLLQEWELTEP